MCLCTCVCVRASQCAKSVLLNKIVSSDKDLVSIVFFGTVSDERALGWFQQVSLLVRHLSWLVREGVNDTIRTKVTRHHGCD